VGGIAGLAQEVIGEALRISPNSILRQRKPGQLAYRNGDYGESEKAYREVVNIGRYSCYRDPRDYSQTAKCMLA